MGDTSHYLTLIRVSLYTIRAVVCAGGYCQRVKRSGVGVIFSV